MPKLTLDIKPDKGIEVDLPSTVSVLMDYSKEIPTEKEDVGEATAPGQRIRLLSRKLEGNIDVDDYADMTTVDLSIKTRTGEHLIGENKLTPRRINRESQFTLEWKIPEADIEVIREAITPKKPDTLKTLVRRGRFIAIGFQAPSFRDFSLLVSPIKNDDLNEELLSNIFDVQEFRTTSRQLSKDLMPRLANLPISSVSTINVELSGRFMFTLPIAENDEDKEDGWIWILSGKETFVGLYKEKTLEAIPNEITILLPAPVDTSTHNGEDSGETTPTYGSDDNSEASSDGNRSGIPVDVSEGELLSEPDLFSDDPGSFCRPFTNPNRIVSERVFHTILRVEQPEIGGSPSVPPDDKRPPYNPVYPFTPVLGTTMAHGSEGTSIGVAAPLSRNVSGSTHRVAGTSVNPLLATNVAIDQRRRWTLKKSRGRYVLDGDDSLDWEGDSFPYQATTLSFGHILDFRVRWRSNGYSLGNVAHTLTLAPRQTKRIVTVESHIRDKIRREESTQAADRVEQETHRDYTYQDAVESHLGEWAKGGSKSSTTGVAGGIGFALGPVVIGGGASHGTSQSDSWTRGGRDVSAKEQQKLQDSIRQYGESLRNLESLVVLEQSQEEFIQGVSEVIRNPNYGHSLTVIYHEILRHLRIDTEVVGAKECVFVPFALKPFTFERALRWRDILGAGLRKQRLRWVMRYLQDIDEDNKYIGSSVPPGPRSTHPIKFLSGSLYIKLAIERPRDDDEGEFNDLNWEPLIPFLGFSPMSVWTRLHEEVEKRRDALFQRDYAKTIAAKWVDTLKLKNMDSADFTLATSYGFNNTIRVDFSYKPDDDSFNRETLVNIIVEAGESLPAKSVANLTKVRLHYYTDTFDKQVFSDKRVDDLINIEDGTPKDEAEFIVQLTDWEKKDMQAEIIEAAKELVSHLNEHSEFYQNHILWSTDRNKLWMMLDSIYLSEEDTRSVASVVEYKPIAIVGNSLVYPVAGGAHIGVDGIETPEELNNHYRDSSVRSEPIRISLPTSGLYAQAIMDECEALEEHFGSTDWVLSDNEPELAELAPELLLSRRADLPDVKPTEFPSSIINLQNAANPPAPSGLTDALNAVQNPGAFRDMAGLAGTQANARAAMETAANLATQFGAKAVDLRKAELAAKIANKKLDIIKKAEKNGLADKEDAKKHANRALEEMNAGETQPLTIGDVKDIANTAGNNKANISVTRNSGEKIEASAREEPTKRRRLLRLTRDGVEEVEEGFVSGSGGEDAFLLGSPPKFSEEVEENLEEIEDIYNAINDKLEEFEDVADVTNAIKKLQELDEARLRWMADREDLAKGINFARKTAEGIAELANFVPDSLPPTVKKYLEGLFSAVPNYVNELTKLLEKKIRAIDKAAAEAFESVEYNEVHGCDDGNIDKKGVRIIKGLDVDEDTKIKIFQSACGFDHGLRGALRGYGQLRFI